MNQRLIQFEKESKLEIFGLGAKRHIWEAALEKYAELIVRECLELCKYSSEEDDDDQFDLGMMYKSREIKTLIKKHFGVEE